MGGGEEMEVPVVVVRFGKFLSLSDCFWAHLSVSIHYCLFLSVAVHFCLFLFVSVNFQIFWWWCTHWGIPCFPYVGFFKAVTSNQKQHKNLWTNFMILNVILILLAEYYIWDVFLAWLHSSVITPVSINCCTRCIARWAQYWNGQGAVSQFLVGGNGQKKVQMKQQLTYCSRFKRSARFNVGGTTRPFRVTLKIS